MERPVIAVVGALCVRGDRVLISRRPPRGPRGGFWELPGGKVEPGEADEHALARELVEELNLEVTVLQKTHSVRHSYEDLDIELRIYLCEAEGEPELIEAAEVMWVSRSALSGFRFTPADRPVVEDLQRNGLPVLP